MRTSFVAFSCLMSWGALHAQQTGIRGRVFRMDARDTIWISGADITTSPASVRTKTDATGRFAITGGLQSGTYVVIAVREAVASSSAPVSVTTGAVAETFVKINLLELPKFGSGALGGLGGISSRRSKEPVRIGDKQTAAPTIDRAETYEMIADSLVETPDGVEVWRSEANAPAMRVSMREAVQAGKRLDSLAREGRERHRVGKVDRSEKSFDDITRVRGVATALRCVSIATVGATIFCMVDVANPPPPPTSRDSLPTTVAKLIAPDFDIVNPPEERQRFLSLRDARWTFAIKPRTAGPKSIAAVVSQEFETKLGTVTRVFPTAVTTVNVQP